MEARNVAVFAATGCRACENAILDINYQVNSLDRWARFVFWPYLLGSRLEDLEKPGDIDVSFFTGAISTGVMKKPREGSGKIQNSRRLRRLRRLRRDARSCQSATGKRPACSLRGADSGATRPAEQCRGAPSDRARRLFCSRLLSASKLHLDRDAVSCMSIPIFGQDVLCSLPAAPAHCAVGPLGSIAAHRKCFCRGKSRLRQLLQNKGRKAVRLS